MFHTPARKALRGGFEEPIRDTASAVGGTV
jgi:hypothetical protein